MTTLIRMHYSQGIDQIIGRTSDLDQFVLKPRTIEVPFVRIKKSEEEKEELTKPDKPLAFPDLQDYTLPNQNGDQFTFNNADEAISKLESQLDAMLSMMEKQKVRKTKLHSLTDKTLQNYMGSFKAHVEKMRENNNKWSFWNEKQRLVNHKILTNLGEKVAMAQTQFYEELGIDTALVPKKENVSEQVQMRIMRFKIGVYRMAQTVDSMIRDPQVDDEILSSYEKDQNFSAVLKKWKEFRSDDPEEIQDFMKNNHFSSREFTQEEVDARFTNDREIFEKIPTIKTRPINEYIDESVFGFEHLTLKFQTLGIIDSNPVTRRFVQDTIRYLVVKYGLEKEFDTLNSNLDNSSEFGSDQMRIENQLLLQGSPLLLSIIFISLITSLLYFRKGGGGMLLSYQDQFMNKIKNGVIAPISAKKTNEVVKQMFGFKNTLEKIHGAINDGGNHLISITEDLDSYVRTGISTPNVTKFAQIEFEKETIPTRVATRLSAESMLVRLINSNQGNFDDQIQIIKEAPFFKRIPSKKRALFISNTINSVDEQVNEAIERERRFFGVDDAIFDENEIRKQLSEKRRAILEPNIQHFEQEVGVSPDEYFQDVDKYSSLILQDNSDRLLMESWNINLNLEFLSNDTQIVKELPFEIALTTGKFRSQIQLIIKWLLRILEKEIEGVDDEQEVLVNLIMSTVELETDPKILQRILKISDDDMAKFFGAQLQELAKRKRQKAFEDEIERDILENAANKFEPLDSDANQQLDVSYLNGTIELIELLSDPFNSSLVSFQDSLARFLGIGRWTSFSNDIAMPSRWSSVVANLEIINYGFYMTVMTGALVFSASVYIPSIMILRNALAVRMAGSNRQSMGCLERISCGLLETGLFVSQQVRPVFWAGSYMLWLGYGNHRFSTEQWDNIPVDGWESMWTLVPLWFLAQSAIDVAGYSIWPFVLGGAGLVMTNNVPSRFTLGLGGIAVSYFTGSAPLKLLWRRMISLSNMTRRRVTNGMQMETLGEQFRSWMQTLFSDISSMFFLSAVLGTTVKNVDAPLVNILLAGRKVPNMLRLGMEFAGPVPSTMFALVTPVLIFLTYITQEERRRLRRIAGTDTDDISNNTIHLNPQSLDNTTIINAVIKAQEGLATLSTEIQRSTIRLRSMNRTPTQSRRPQGRRPVTRSVTSATRSRSRGR